MKMAFDLAPEQESKWEELFSGAWKASDAEEHAAAVSLIDEAWNVIPEPKFECSIAYITVMRRIAVRYRACQWEAGAEIARRARETTPFDRQIPVFSVREGVGLFEAGRTQDAWKAFDAGWKCGGRFGFKGEDPKYLSFYRKRSD